MKQIIQKIVIKSIGLYINLLSYVLPDKSFAIAYKLFSEPRKGKIKNHKIPKTLQKAIHETHILNEHQFLTYTWQGNDDVILLVHGWESNASRWKKLLVYLKKTGKTIIAIDGPAHGMSNGKEFNVPIYSEFIDKVVQKYNPKIAIGHSIGGNAIAYFQAHYKHNFEKIILLGAPSDFKVILNNYINMLSLNDFIHQSFINYTKKRFNLTIDELSASKFLKDSTISGLIAHDIDDNVVLFEEGEKISNSWKNAKFIETKGLGHSMHDENLYQTIVEFVNTK
ncbi:alpha/beta fold hydrolase [Flavobacterium sp.]|uniref:alpha/beta fold hydrolase n=1 Tax=Flavobacterium sp. TaxID=239 RepID=UPI003751794B